MTLTLGAECAVLPASERTRHYRANVSDLRGGGQIVTLLDGTFLDGSICTSGSDRFSQVGCNQFFMTSTPAGVRFSLENNNDEAHGGHIVERLSSGGWIEVIGGASASAAASSADLTVATGDASVWFCAAPIAYPFPCSAVRSCETSLNLTLKHN